MVAIIPASAQREVKSRSVCTNVRPMAVSGDRGESSATSMYSVKMHDKEQGQL